MTLQSDFDAAAEKARKDLPSSLSNDTKGKLYALYKQATEGDVTGTRPNLLQMTAQFKYDSWKEMEGTSKEDAMQQYITLVNSL